MKKSVNWRLFRLLLIACIASSILVLPYIMALSPDLAKLLTPLLLVAQIVQAGILFSVAIYVGLLLYPKVGFTLPVLDGTAPVSHLRSVLKSSIILGVLSGVFVILGSIPFGSLSLSLMKAEMQVPLWKAFLASLYGGIAEEVLFRLFLMTTFVWVSTKIKKTSKGQPTSISIWVVIIASSLLFGLGHLGITSSLTAITPIIILRAVILNSVSIVFGWLYWKKGLESAMIAHFTADIVLHVITPLVARIFMQLVAF